jgi:16S rRNA (guanine527-N7)-methyltransferase
MPDRGPSGRVSDRAERSPLPTDPDACPALAADFSGPLDAALASLGLVLTRGQRVGIEAQVRLLLAWNEAINLTAIRRPTAIAVEHVADALTAVPALHAVGIAERPSLLDLCSGAGYPGLPLGLVLAAGRLTLVDSVAKKARFLRVAGSAATAAMSAAGEDVPALDVIADRIEAVARDARHRARYDVVTARAVGPLVELAELGLPLLRRGGRLLAWKRTDEDRADARAGRALEVELAAAGRLVPALGGTIEDVQAIRVPGLEDHRLVVVRAERLTPAAYPRSPTERQRERR